MAKNYLTHEDIGCYVINWARNGRNPCYSESFSTCEKAEDEIINAWLQTKTPDVDVLDYLSANEFIEAVKRETDEFGRDIRDIDDARDAVANTIANSFNYQFARKKEYEQEVRDYILDDALEHWTIVEVTDDMVDDDDDDDDDDE